MKWIYWFGWMTFGAAFRSLFGLRVIGAGNLITEGPVLVASNHQSFLDPPLIGNLYQDEMTYLARKTLFNGFTRWLYRHWNAIPVDQERPDMASLKTLIRKLREGRRVLVFPEGSRTMDGTIGEAAPGIGLIAVKAGVPIQPVRISGAREALPRGSARIRFARITVQVGPPIMLAAEEIRGAKSKDDYDRIARRIMAAIKALDPPPVV
jgi:1-acyl-sn-glycerol-3-phosphate acyltransferase